MCAESVTASFEQTQQSTPKADSKSDIQKLVHTAPARAFVDLALTPRKHLEHMSALRNYSEGRIFSNLYKLLAS